MSPCTLYRESASHGAPTWQHGEISRHPSYHGTMSSARAEEKLKDQGISNCYLTRYCEEMESYTISVLSESRIEHYILNICKCNGVTFYEIDGTENPFDSICELLEFYQNCPVSRKLDSFIGKEIVLETHSTRQKPDSDVSS